jgi:cytochrome c
LLNSPFKFSRDAVVPTAAAAGTVAPAAMALSIVLAALVAPTAAGAGGPSARGKILFLRCASCHDATPGASAKIGPDLYGVVGRKAASLPGFSYSAALKSQDFVWDPEHLDRWIENPNAVAPGTIMAFAGIADAADRRAIIEYLQQQGSAASSSGAASGGKPVGDGSGATAATGPALSPASRGANP